MDTPSASNEPLTVVIMQPTYLPWVGYFDLMDQADVFVYLDCVQFAKRSWQQRNRIKTAQGELMLTIPVLTKGAQDQKISEVRIDGTARFEKKHLKSIESSYAKAPHYREVFPALEAVYGASHSDLADLNIALIESFANLLGIRSRRIRASELQVDGHKVDLLVSICKKVGATQYLSPPGSKVYIDENNRFPVEGIDLRYHVYEPAQYSQLYGDFLPYMSVVDLLFNYGAPSSLEVIRKGRGA